MGIIEIFFENWTSIALRIISDLISRLVIVDFKSQAYMWDIAQSSIIHGPHDDLFHNQNQDNGCATNLTYCSDSHLNLILKKKKSKINQKERKKDLLSQSILSLKSNAPKKKNSSACIHDLDFLWGKYPMGSLIYAGNDFRKVEMLGMSGFLCKSWMLFTLLHSLIIAVF